MNFFSAQDQARRRTTLLVVLFALAVLALISLTCLLVNACWFLLRGGPVMHWQVNAWIALGVVAAVGLASLFRLLGLAGGGQAVAEAVGARRLARNSADPQERRLLNVVEEMAIASGTPVPPVYVMDAESGINAFAAGYTPADAVIAVTRGTLVLLNRDQLQGVIAHEFSHILNGDMKLNIRLIALLAGILFIGESGRFILRTFSDRNGLRVRRSNSNGKGGGGIVALLALGLGLMVVGYAGVFFGNLIKAAVSRQREFLADASAVQFTRNPDGIAGALKLIGGHVLGAQVRNPAAGEISHLFFGEALHSRFSSLFATHPKLQERIRAIEPRWDGRFIQPPKEAVAAIARQLADEVRQHGVGTLATRPATAAAAAAATATTVATTPLEDAVGQAGTGHLDLAQRLIAAIPDPLRDAAHDAWSAQAVMHALLLDTRPAIRERQLALLHKDDAALAALAGRLAADCQGLDTRCRLPLVEMTMPALKAMSAAQFSAFRRQLVALAQADAVITPFEWALARLLIHDLGPAFGQARPPAPQYRSLRQLGPPCQTVLSFLASLHAGADTPGAESAYAAGARSLGLVLPFNPTAAHDLQALGAAIDTLARCYPLVKPGLLKAFARTLAADRDFAAVDAEMLRALAAILDCPLPPIELPAA